MILERRWLQLIFKVTGSENKIKMDTEGFKVS
jgi:hypothetical protein